MWLILTTARKYCCFLQLHSSQSLGLLCLFQLGGSYWLQNSCRTVPHAHSARKLEMVLSRKKSADCLWCFQTVRRSGEVRINKMNRTREGCFFPPQNIKSLATYSLKPDVCWSVLHFFFVPSNFTFLTLRFLLFFLLCAIYEFRWKINYIVWAIRVLLNGYINTRRI